MCQVLNVSRFWLFQDFQYPIFLSSPAYTWFTYFRKYNSSEYALGCYYGMVLNLQGFQICQVSTYTNITQGSKCA